MKNYLQVSPRPGWVEQLPSFFRAADGTVVPEFDRFAVLPWAEALPQVGRNLQRVLNQVRAGPAWPPFAAP